MYAAAPLSLAIRSYGAGHEAHRHDFMQLVLPLEGSISISIGGVEGRLHPALAGVVPSNAPHVQEGHASNRSLIVDLDPRALGSRMADRLSSQPLLALSPEASSLINYMGLSLASGGRRTDRVRLWTPLLLDALVGQEPQPQSRLSALLATVEADPFAPWTAERMAERAGLSVSRLHAVFRDEMDATPRAWLSRLRLAHAQECLTNSSQSIAQVAYRCGYSDQAALTRALRKATGETPAAFRRRTRELRPRVQEPAPRNPDADGA